MTAVFDELETLLGSRFTRSAPVCAAHAAGESFHAARPPDAVAFVETEAEVSGALALCNEAGVPVVPFGAGTSVEGQVQAVRGGVSLDLSGMNRITRVSGEDLDCSVEAGVTRQQLNRELRHSGLFFPVDPGADATLGGMAATRASGTTTLRYGAMPDNVLGMRAVLADGRVIRCGGRARKSAAGYDLARLMIGSEGTLAVITELTLRLRAQPEQVAAAVLRFPGIKQAVACVIAAQQHCLGLARCELLDRAAIRAINADQNTDYPEQDCLFVEFHGAAPEVEYQVSLLQQLAAEQDCSNFDWACHEEDRGRLWQARHQAYRAAIRCRPGGRGYTTDVCVPITALARCLADTRADLDQSFLDAAVVGHVGDGNFHLLFSVCPEIKRERDELHRLSDRLVERALALGGTCTGEHGIGLGKQQYLLDERGAAVEVMRSLKQALDPNGILNPEKIFL